MGVGSGYVYRPEQVGLASAIADAFSDKAALLADAPTGTGKSDGYLSPVALGEHRTVVSTGTKALQRQLVAKDLPAIRAACASACINPPSDALLKARGDFLCDRRLDEHLKTASIFEDSFEEFMTWRESTTTGDVEDLPIKRPDYWREIASDGDDCVRKKCKYSHRCHYFSDRETAQDADILVVNHALLLVNIASGGAVFELGNRYLILDEAHQLEDYVSELFGAEVTFYRCRYVLRVIEKKAADLDSYTLRVRNYAEAFFLQLSEHTILGNKTTPRRLTRIFWGRSNRC